MADETIGPDFDFSAFAKAQELPEALREPLKYVVAGCSAVAMLLHREHGWPMEQSQALAREGMFYALVCLPLMEKTLETAHKGNEATYHALMAQIALLRQRLRESRP